MKIQGSKGSESPFSEDPWLPGGTSRRKGHLVHLGSPWYIRPHTRPPGTLKASVSLHCHWFILHTTTELKAP